jgi:hypothetical protein
MRPVTRSIDLPGGRWYVATGRLASAAAGSAAYQLITKRTQVGELGIYRHGEPNVSEGTHVTAVSISRPDVLRVARLLASRGAVDVELHPELVKSLCVRRARVVTEHAAAGGPAGRTHIHHAGRGATLNPDGTMTEPEPGRG